MMRPKEGSILAIPHVAPLKILIMIALACALAVGCTARNTVPMPCPVEHGVIVTAGDLDREYESLGALQVSVFGSWLVGVVPIVKADLQKAFYEQLLVEAKERGADAVINIRYYEFQYTPGLRAIVAFFIISPQWAYVTGELVRFTEPKLPLDEELRQIRAKKGKPKVGKRLRR